ncbi:TraM recognition domain-containing protein [Pseudonocardia sp. NPDC049635]|uniref:type IV secretory system conjugative DNA transfer family protein n=1 Tax=Pseudonocardia sp. NPDC049635 TaxID=3155506 RepID=UPI0033CDC280
MSTAGPPLAWQQMAVPLVGLGVLGAGFVSMACCWVAAAVAAEPAPPAFGGATLRALVTAGGAGTLDPLIGADGSRPLFWGVLALVVVPVLVTVVAAAVWVSSRSASRGVPRSVMARGRETRDMRGRAARARAQQLRPALREQRTVQARDLGLCLGRRLGGAGQSRLLYASEEDVVLQIAGPRSNKTSALVVPAILSAPGPVIATSNKGDIYTLTVGVRSELGRVFVADPQRIAGVEQDWWWNPLRHIRDLADAAQLVTHFSRTVGSGSDRSDPFFTKGAERLLGQLVLAASCSPDTSLRDVRRWLATQATEPVTLLEHGGYSEVAVGLQGLLEAPVETRGGLFETALTALGALESEAVARLVTPPSTWKLPPRVPVTEFDPWRFLVGYHTGSSGAAVPRDTMYLLTREGAGSGAPVIAALVDDLLRVATQAATAEGGRLSTPLRPVLDEAANVCPIANLPDLYSYFGSMSIQVMTFLQSYQQGVAIWGRSGMHKMWSASTIKLVGAGVQDPEFARWVSDLIGPVEVPTYSQQYGRGGGSTSTSWKEKPVMTVADVAALDKRNAILLSAGRRPVLLELMPWYRERDAEAITAYAAEATAQVQQSAVAALGARNPLAQRLSAGGHATGDRL